MSKLAFFLGQGGSGGDAELNIHYGTTEPTDKTKLWIKESISPSKVDMTNGLTIGNSNLVPIRTSEPTTVFDDSRKLLFGDLMPYLYWEYGDNHYGNLYARILNLSTNTLVANHNVNSGQHYSISISNIYRYDGTYFYAYMYYSTTSSGTNWRYISVKWNATNYVSSGATTTGYPDGVQTWYIPSSETELSAGVGGGINDKNFYIWLGTNGITINTGSSITSYDFIYDYKRYLYCIDKGKKIVYKVDTNTLNYSTHTGITPLASTSYVSIHDENTLIISNTNPKIVYACNLATGVSTTVLTNYETATVTEQLYPSQNYTPNSNFIYSGLNSKIQLNVPLTNNNLAINHNSNNSRWQAVKSDNLNISLNPTAVYLGDSSNQARKINEVYLYQSNSWQKI